MQQNTLWNDVLRKLEKRINRPSFNTWLRPTSLVSLVDRHVCIGVPDEVFVYWLGEYYVNVITDILAETLGGHPEIVFVVTEEAEAGNGSSVPQRPSSQAASQHPQQTSLDFSFTSPRSKPVPSVKIGKQRAVSGISGVKNVSQTRRQAARVSVGSDADTPRPQSPPAATAASASGKRDFSAVAEITKSWKPQVSKNAAASEPVEKNHTASSLHSKYTFDSYVVGNGNRFAHAAALAVADQMAVNYNPLFVYGGVGLGKTHLLHAIGNHVAALKQATRILYLSSEHFINELIGSIREDRMVSFRSKYRNIDLLLIDDIQFIARKERTQEEFFHTFNTLYHERKQIVLTSDCPPKKIPTIAEQLRSRFEWGLIADIQPPDLETRVAILKKKADGLGVFLPDEVALFIGNKVRSNIRELEGCLSKLKAYSTFHSQPITLDLARHVLHDLFEMTPKRVTVELVQQTVANHYHIEVDAMTSSGRSRDITLPRQIAMYLSRELTNLSLPDIGRNFGGRDHSTVLHACKKIEKILARDEDTVKTSIMQLRNLIMA